MTPRGQHAPATFDAAPQPADRALRGLPPWTYGELLVLIALLLVGGGLRLTRLSVPAGVMFDETYYAKDACLYASSGGPKGATGGQERCGLNQATEQSWVHPEVGKWLIAAGIKIFGYREFGWRVSAALFGTLMIPLVFLLARVLFRDRTTAGLAGLLIAADPLMIVQSRIAMLDIFLAFFVVAGFVFLAFDRDRLLRARDALSSGVRLPRRYGWRLAAGAALGLAVSTKWSAAWGLAGAALLATTWSITFVGSAARARRVAAPPAEEAADGAGDAEGDDDGERPRSRGTSAVGSVAVKELVSLIAAFVLVPLAVYLLGYAPWFGEHHLDLSAFADLHRRMLNYHLTLKATHSYQSRAWTWPLILRPVAYYWKSSPLATHIDAIGNPATWWAALMAVPWLLARSARRWAPQRLVVAGWASQFLPWLIVARPLFFFYMTPVVPFMMLGLASGLRSLAGRSRGWRALVVAFVVLGVGVMVVWLYPIIAAVGLPIEQWRSRMLLRTWI
ncbi:MAG: phospholipid carrier-dependent glycosyltransferase [Actinomycetota bacterium]